MRCVVHTQLLNIGFTKREDGTYIHHELGVIVVIKEGEAYVRNEHGDTPVTIPQLEDAMVSGELGVF